MVVLNEKGGCLLLFLSTTDIIHSRLGSPILVEELSYVVSSASNSSEVKASAHLMPFHALSFDGRLYNTQDRCIASEVNLARSRAIFVATFEDFSTYSRHSHHYGY